MFDEQVVADLDAAVAGVCAAGLDLATTDQLRGLLSSVVAAADSLVSVRARALGVFEGAGGHEEDGCSTIGTWTRNHLRLTTGEVAAAKRSAKALNALPGVRAAAETGAIRPGHVEKFGHGIGLVGPDPMREAEDILLPVATACDPAELETAIDKLHHATDPDDPDAAWVKAQEKQDFTITRAGQYGYQLRGFVSLELGAKLRLLNNIFAKPMAGTDLPDGVDKDQRPIAQRRIEGLAALVDDYLGSGLGMDKGERPHLNITASLAELTHALTGDRSTGTGDPATLVGHGVIGRDLLARLACDADLSLVVTDATNDQHRTGCPLHGGATVTGVTGGVSRFDPSTILPGLLHACGCPVTPFISVLDVGRTRRTATPKQRLAVLIGQGYRCAMPGCNNRHLEVHHILEWYADDGPTDMDNLIGLCVGCHTLIHRRLLQCVSDGHGGAVFATAAGHRITDIRRRALADYARHLTDYVSAGLIDQTRPPGWSRDLWTRPLERDPEPEPRPPDSSLLPPRRRRPSEPETPPF